jgi:hypothetical protein
MLIKTMTFNNINLKGQLPSNLNWSTKLEDFHVNDKEISAYAFGKILSVGEIEIFNNIKGSASCFFDKKDNFNSITLLLVDHNDESANIEFQRVKKILSDLLGEYYLETESSFYQTHYCWNLDHIKLILWIGCLDKSEINSLSLRIVKLEKVEGSKQ